MSNMDPLPEQGKLMSGSCYTQIPVRNKHGAAPRGYPCSCPRYLWDVYARKIVSPFLDAYKLWWQHGLRGYDVYTAHYLECTVLVKWLAGTLDSIYGYEPSGCDWGNYELEDDTLEIFGFDQDLENKLCHALKREASQVKRTRNRREYQGKRNRSRAWDQMSSSVQPKLSRRERGAMESTEHNLATVGHQWEESEHKGKRNTAARLMYWKRGFCCCVMCSELYSTLMERYKRTRKADMQKLACQYQVAKNRSQASSQVCQGGLARKGPTLADFMWELLPEYSDGVEYLTEMEHDGKRLPLPSGHEINLIQLLKPGRQRRKHAKPLFRAIADDPPGSPAVSALSSDWDDVSVASTEDFVMV